MKGWCNGYASGITYALRNADPIVREWVSNVMAELLHLVGVLVAAVSPFVLIGLLVGKKKYWLSVVCVVVYLLAYVVLSAKGQYLEGNYDGRDNRATWYALACGKEFRKPSGRVSTGGTILVWFFWPPTLIDRLLVHKTKTDVF